MEQIQGKTSRMIETTELRFRLAAYQRVLVDLGTGDGRFVLHQARLCPTVFAIGVDACREHLQETSRRPPANVLFLAANVLALPDALAGVATQVTINFPWGSLLEWLLEGNTTLLDGLKAITRPGAPLEVRLNGGALAEAGWTLEPGSERVGAVLRRAGWRVGKATPLDAAALRACPTSWAKRLAFGRDPRAVALTAAWSGAQTTMCALQRAS